MIQVVGAFQLYATMGFVGLKSRASVLFRQDGCLVRVYLLGQYITGGSDGESCHVLLERAAESVLRGFFVGENP